MRKKTILLWLFALSIVGLSCTKKSDSLAPFSPNSPGVNSGSNITPTPTGPANPTPTTMPDQSSCPCRLEVIQGQGMVTNANWPFGEEVVIRLSDKNMKPLSGVTLSFTPTLGAGFIAVTTSNPVTDNNGLARWSLRGTYAEPHTPASIAKVRASASAIQHELFVDLVMQVIQNNSSGTFHPLFQRIAPENSTSIRIQKNSTLSSAIKMGFAYSTGVAVGQGMPFVGMRVELDYTRFVNVPAILPEIQCQERTVLSETNGIANCNLSVNSVIGTFPILVKAFGANEYRSLWLEIY